VKLGKYQDSSPSLSRRALAGRLDYNAASMTLSGLSVGFGVAAGTVRYLGGFPFGVSPLDPATFVLVGSTLTEVALIA